MGLTRSNASVYATNQHPPLAVSPFLTLPTWRHRYLTIHRRPTTCCCGCCFLSLQRCYLRCCEETTTWSSRSSTCVFMTRFVEVWLRGVGEGGGRSDGGGAMEVSGLNEKTVSVRHSPSSAESTDSSLLTSLSLLFSSRSYDIALR